MRRLLCLIFFILTAGVLYASTTGHVKKEAPKAKAILRTDTSAPVQVRHFDTAALKAYSKNPDFQYKDEVIQASWWERFWKWFWHWLDHLFDSGPKKNANIGNSWDVFFKYLFITLGIAALVFLIFKLIGVDMKNIFRKKSASAIPFSEFFEDINAIDFDREIENAVAKHNYRFAVRLLYLKSLKQLSEAGLIEWKIEKTNSAYIDELNNDDHRAAFKMLTMQFEYVWYGEFLIDAPVYSNINSSFQDFNKRVA